MPGGSLSRLRRALDDAYRDPATVTEMRSRRRATAAQDLARAQAKRAAAISGHVVAIAISLGTR